MRHTVTITVALFISAKLEMAAILAISALFASLR